MVRRGIIPVLYRDRPCALKGEFLCPIGIILVLYGSVLTLYIE